MIHFTDGVMPSQTEYLYFAIDESPCSRLAINYCGTHVHARLWAGRVFSLRNWDPVRYVPALIDAWYNLSEDYRKLPVVIWDIWIKEKLNTWNENVAFGQEPAEPVAPFDALMGKDLDA